MLELEQAQEQILSGVQPLESETLPLRSALSRFLCQDIISNLDLPPFDNSAMDGYAVQASDTLAATAEHPVSLKLVGKVAAGETFTTPLSRGQCLRIFTGSPLPPGADAVIMQEDTESDPARNDLRRFLCGAKPWENVRFKGEDVEKGTTVLRSGDRLDAGRTALLAAIGCGEVNVRRRPVVGLVATGTELRDCGEILAPGQIYESNRAGLAALASGAGAMPKIFPLVQDTLIATAEALNLAFAECDIVVSSGGVSVGELDFVKDAFQSIGGELSFWRIAIKPGKPLAFGRRQNKLFFGLPGNPISAFVTFLLLVRPAVLQLQGANELHLRRMPGILDEPLVNKGDRRHFARVVLDGTGHCRLAGKQASHLLHSLAQANGLVDIPKNATLAAGAIVSVLSWT